MISAAPTLPLAHPIEKGLVSIIMPTYNRAEMLMEAIQSAQSQTHARTQIIVVDDGSTDDTQQRLESVENITVLCQPQSGQGAARAHGFQHCRGEFIASLDSDDLWDEDFLARSVAAMEDFELDFVFSSWRARPGERFFIDKWLRRNRRQRRPLEQRGDWNLLTPQQTRDLYITGCPSPSSSLVMRRTSMVSNWTSEAKISDDWQVVLEMVLRRPCRAGFALTALWSKRTDGQNICDGRLKEEVVRELFLHDTPFFRRKFRAYLTSGETARLRFTEWSYRLFMVYRRVRAQSWGRRRS